MTNFEMVEILREKANVTYEEAKAALELADWDLLDAMLLLEKEGKVADGTTASYSTRPEEKEPEKKSRHENNITSAFRWLMNTLRKLVRIGNSNHFVVTHKEKEHLSLPVTVLAILLICFFWTTVAVLAIGLFCGLRYNFKGPNLGKDSINDAMNKAADAAENVKQEIRNSSESESRSE